ncbi:MAG TPA: cellulose synthase complex periplasmic endoglucanase BcsZ [Acidobacteriaceae bacterium]
MDDPGQNQYRPRVVRKTLMHVCVVAAVIAMSLLAGDGCRAEQKPWPLWESYVKGFIDQQGRVIDHTGGDRTTSEAQAYAMFFALVANDRAHFDKLLAWTQSNLAQGDLTERLPAWNWGKTADGQWKVLDPNSASDADLWMTYDLLEAGSLWHDAGYTKIGTAMAERIAKQEVALLPPSCAAGPLLLPAPQGFHPDDYTWIMNPSYAPLPVLQYLATRMPQGPWGAMVQELPRFYNHTSTAGYAPDWSKCIAGQGWVPTPAPGQQPTQGQAGQKGAASAPPAVPATPAAAAIIPGAQPAATQPVPPPTSIGSFDAIRVYLWLGISDPDAPEVQASLESFHGMAAYLSHNAIPPRTVDNSGSVKNAEGPLSFSAAVIPYLQVLGQKAAAKAQMDRLAGGLDKGSGLYGSPAYYYDQNMALFANGWMEKRYRIEKDGSLKLKWK